MTDRCEENATRRIFWPGREPMGMCERHAQGAVTIGKAIGCYIHTEPGPNGLRCESSRGEHQTITTR